VPRFGLAQTPGSNMTPKNHFDAAMERADHLLRLYALLHDTRVRKIRADWAAKLTALMHWPRGEKIARVDGKDRNSILLLREAAGVDRDKFTHEYLSELLRATVVATVSALDRYMHDIVVHHSWSLLSKTEGKIPKELKKLRIPVLSARYAVDKIRSAAKARPGVLVKEAIRNQLHREFTFQKPEDVHQAAKMLGVEDFWGKVAAAMPGAPRKDVVMETLRQIANRRNQIVHEADLVRKARAKSITMREISLKTALKWADWMRDLVIAIDSTVEEAV
jgi:RiboL-PSP-HEPN